MRQVGRASRSLLGSHSRGASCLLLPLLLGSAVGAARHVKRKLHMLSATLLLSAACLSSLYTDNRIALAALVATGAILCRLHHRRPSCGVADVLTRRRGLVPLRTAASFSAGPLPTLLEPLPTERIRRPTSTLPVDQCAQANAHTAKIVVQSVHSPALRNLGLRVAHPHCHRHHRRLVAQDLPYAVADRSRVLQYHGCRALRARAFAPPSTAFISSPRVSQTGYHFQHAARWACGVP